MEQYEIYKNAGLYEAEINGRKCLIKDIDMDYVDPKTGMTNRERLAHRPRSLSPIDKKKEYQNQKDAHWSARAMED